MIRYSTLFKFLLLAGILAGAGWVIWQAYCSSCCKSALVEADRLSPKGNFREALYEIDDADAMCDCLSQSKDAEPLILIRARELYRNVARVHGEAAAYELAKYASGPILQSFAGD